MCADMTRLGIRSWMARQTQVPYPKVGRYWLGIVPALPASANNYRQASAIIAPSSRSRSNYAQPSSSAPILLDTITKAYLQVLEAYINRICAAGQTPPQIGHNTDRSFVYPAAGGSLCRAEDTRSSRLGHSNSQPFCRYDRIARERHHVGQHSRTPHNKHEPVS